MRLAKLTGLEIEKLEEELKEVRAMIKDLRALLELEAEAHGDPQGRSCAKIVEKYGDERRTEITSDEGEFTIEDLIAEEDMVVTISHSGYIKRTSVSTYRKQRRGGRGLNGQGLKDEDFVEQLFVGSHARLHPRLHRRRALLLAQGARDPAGGPRREGQADRQPDQRHARHEDPGDGVRCASSATISSCSSARSRAR